MQCLIAGRDSGFFAERLAPRVSGLRFVPATDSASALAVCAESEILIIRTDEISAALVGAMPRLRLIQALTTGTDHIEAVPNLSPKVMIAAARGFHGPQMSELAFLFMLALIRDVRTVLANQKQKKWDRRSQRLLSSRTAMIIGVGHIAEALAQRCKLFGMRVVGVSTRRQSAPGFDAIHPRGRLREVAGEADFLIVLAPYTKETHHLIGSEVFDAMKPDAFLINLARGGVVDEAALAHGLKAKRIAGAGLDVFQTEPLPPESPLWDLDNVIITSHVGGMSDTYSEQVLPLLIDNLRAFVAGKPDRMKFIVRAGNPRS